jgi:hypothetical protein
MQHEDYVHNAIIPPPEQKGIEKDVKHTRVVFDSKDRDVTLFPDQNAYDVRFDDDIDDVLGVRLLSMDVPLVAYMINTYFDRFTLVFGSSTYEVVLDQGDFEAPAFATMVTAKMQQSTGAAANTFLMEYNAVKDNFIFKAKAPFSIDFPQKNSLHYAFGMKKQLYVSATESGTFGHAIRAEFRKNFKFNNYAILSIDGFDLNHSNGDTLHRTFAVVVPNYSNMNFGDAPKLIKRFTPPIPRLAKISIRFTDRFGNPYDFQNMDHRIELDFESYKQKRKYQNIFMNR